MGSLSPPEAAQLGELPEATYTLSWGRRVLFLLGGVVFTLLGIGMAIFNLPLVVSGEVCLGVYILITGIFLALGVGLLRIWYQDRGWRVMVFADGLLSVRGGQADAIRWDQVRSVWQIIAGQYSFGAEQQKMTSFTLVLDTGQTVRFDDSLADVRVLGETIQGEVTRRLLPRAMETYESGGTVPFGALGLSQQGLSHKGKVLPWNEFKRIQDHNGLISIQQAGRRTNWAAINSAEIPNLYVFLAMLDQIVGSGRH